MKNIDRIHDSCNSQSVSILSDVSLELQESEDWLFTNIFFMHADLNITQNKLKKTRLIEELSSKDDVTNESFEALTKEICLLQPINDVWTLEQKLCENAESQDISEAFDHMKKGEVEKDLFTAFDKELKDDCSIDSPVFLEHDSHISEMLVKKSYEEISNIINRQILARIAVIKNEGGDDIEKIMLHLHPENLGSIEIICSFSLSGMLDKINMVFENKFTYDMLKDSTSQLLLMLSSIGINTTTVNLTLQLKKLKAVEKEDTLKSESKRGREQETLVDRAELSLRNVVIDISDAISILV